MLVELAAVLVVLVLPGLDGASSATAQATEVPLAPSIVFGNFPHSIFDVNDGIVGGVDHQALEKIVDSADHTVILTYPNLTSAAFYKKVGAYSREPVHDEQLSGLEAVASGEAYSRIFPTTKPGILDLGNAVEMDVLKLEVADLGATSERTVTLINLNRGPAAQLFERFETLKSRLPEDTLFVFTPLTTAEVAAAVREPIQSAKGGYSDSDDIVDGGDYTFAAVNARTGRDGDSWSTAENASQVIAFQRRLQAEDDNTVDIIRTTPFHLASTIYMFVFLFVALVGVSCLMDLSTPASFEHRTLDINKEY